MKLEIRVQSPDVGTSRFLAAEGARFTTGDGDLLYLNSINLGNWLLWEGYLMMGDFQYRTHSQFLDGLARCFGSMERAREFEHAWRLNYVSEGTIIDLKALGFNSVRVPFHYNMFWRDGKLSDHGFQYLDRLIGWCRKRDVYILLDMHAAPGAQNPGDHSDNLLSNESQPRDSVKFWDGDNVAIAAKVWRHIAARYHAEPMIWGYDLLNEPVLPPGREYELLPSYIRLCEAIREVDTRHLISAQGGWWGSLPHYIDWTDPKTRAATGVREKWDDKLTFQLHHYVFGDAGLVRQLDERVSVGDRLGVPTFLGEYGEDTETILRAMTDWAVGSAAGHAAWSFKKVSHDRTLWTTPSTPTFDVVRSAIARGLAAPETYSGMMAFANENVVNGHASMRWHQGFYDAIKVAAQPASMPCAGAPATVLPARIEAEGFCARHGGLQVVQSGRVSYLGYLSSADWAAYPVEAPVAGVYRLSCRVASPHQSGRLEFRCGGETLAALAIPQTKGWESFATIRTDVRLPAGRSVVKLHVAEAGFNIDWFELQPR